jgi:copper chaperone
MKFKTNINCQNCVVRVKPTLDALVGEKNWVVDTESLEKILKVVSTDIAENQVIDSLKKIGFVAGSISADH